MTIERPMFPPTRRAFINTIAALPLAAAAPAGAQTPDAELIDLGAKFEPLLDQYYLAHRRWSDGLAQASSEHNAEFGPAAA